MPLIFYESPNYLLTSESVTGFLFKPFDLAEFRQVVRLAIDARPELLAEGVR